MTDFKLNFEGMPLAVLSSYMTGAEIAYYRGLGFHTIEQLYAALVALPIRCSRDVKALKACKQNLTQEKMDTLAPVQDNYSTGLWMDG